MSLAQPRTSRYLLHVFFTFSAEALLVKVSTEHAQFEHSNQAVIEGLQQERDNLQSHLQQRMQENEQLTK